MRDVRHLASLAVVLLIVVFGLTAVLTPRDPLNPYWITLFTTILGLNVAAAAAGKDNDDDDKQTWVKKLGRKLSGVDDGGAQGVREPGRQTPPSDDSSDRHYRRWLYLWPLVQPTPCLGTRTGSLGGGFDRLSTA